MAQIEVGTLALTSFKVAYNSLKLSVFVTASKSGKENILK